MSHIFKTEYESTRQFTRGYHYSERICNSIYLRVIGRNTVEEK